MYKKIFRLILLSILCFQIAVVTAQNVDGAAKQKTTYYGPGGTYSDWHFPKGKYESIEWTFVPVVAPPKSLAQQNLLHYYAYNFSIVDASGKRVKGGYCGFQTNGIFKGQQKGKVINFSIWDSNGGKTDGLLNGDNEESNGYQIMYKYDWIEGNHYAFQLKKGPSAVDSLGTWWGLWVTDITNNTTTLVGEIRLAPNQKEQKDLWLGDHTSMFGEDLHWWLSLSGRVKYKDCTQFEPSAMAAIDISANGTIRPISFANRTNSGELATADNGFKSINCNVTIYQDSMQFNVQHNLGYWPTAAPNSLIVK